MNFKRLGVSLVRVNLVSINPFWEMNIQTVLRVLFELNACDVRILWESGLSDQPGLNSEPLFIQNISYRSVCDSSSSVIQISVLSLPHKDFNLALSPQSWVWALNIRDRWMKLKKSEVKFHFVAVKRLTVIHKKNIRTLMPASTSGAVLGSVSCLRTLWHADTGNRTSNLQLITQTNKYLFFPQLYKQVVLRGK